MPSVLSKHLYWWDREDAQKNDMTPIFKNEVATNHGNNGDYHWWVETVDKKIIDESPLPHLQYDMIDVAMDKMMGINYTKPVYFEWTDPKLVSKMTEMRIKHLHDYKKKVGNGVLKKIMKDIWKRKNFTTGSCDINAEIVHKHYKGSRLCVGTFGYKCNDGTVLVCYGT
jgi:hypothetical protein